MTSEYKPYIQMVINIYRWIIGIVGSIVFTEIMQLLYVKYMNLRFKICESDWKRDFTDLCHAMFFS